jgi:hypothetical protein
MSRTRHKRARGRDRRTRGAAIACLASRSPVKSLAALAAAVVLSTSLGTGVASAHKPVPKSGAKATPGHVKRTVTVSKVAQDAGSAGVPGYDDKRCQQLLNDANAETDRAIDEASDGNARGFRYHSDIATHAVNELTDNCLVVY